jgi:two-component system sensor histidine kinase VicK
MIPLINRLQRRLNFFLGTIPKQGRSRYEIHQVRIFNKLLFYISLLALASVPVVGFQSNVIERITAIGLLVVVFWGLILLNKKGYDHIARPVYIVFGSVFNGYISYREGHHLNTYLVLFLIPMLGFAITPRNRPLGILFSIVFPLAVLFCLLFVDIPWIEPIERSEAEIKRYANIATIVYFALFIYSAWLLINLNNRVHHNLMDKIEANRKITRELIRQGQELRIAQQLAKVGFWEVTSDGQTRWSKETYEILHMPLDSVINRETIAANVHPDDVEFVIENLIKGAQEGGKYSFDFRLHPKHGERWIAVSCIQSTYVPDKNFFHSKGIVQDITTAKQTEQQLLQTIAYKDRVIATVSHDLRNPVANTLQLLDMVAAELQKSNYGQGKKLLLEYQEMMRLSQKRTMEIIEDLLELCTRKNIVHLSGQKTDLFSLAEQTVYPQIYRATKKGVLLQLKPAKNDIIINAVPDKIARALENLIVNAIKFTPMGGKITVSVEKSEGFALIAVADTGIGIPDHLKEHLFEQFGAARRYGTEGESSTGLGLSIVKQWVEMHNGTVWHEDNKPNGTIFYMSFPLAEADNTSQSRGMDDDSRLANTF